ncbi:hypothetical protein SAMD00023353_0400930 [Rosellinia necatrix]|uniref:Uncharacterized protein n=1 Tax=Rosellinia necatrix TaxID=77044 RepID=A0A1S8A5V6_ROSNE|nr:hypothetical protein SAMD00023353_0400930 [Rosellinia necatrix]
MAPNPITQASPAAPPHPYRDILPTTISALTPSPNAAISNHGASTKADLLAGLFFGVAAALLLIALPLTLCNYCRWRRPAARDGQLQV